MKHISQKINSVDLRYVQTEQT